MSELEPSVYNEHKTRRTIGALAGLALAWPLAAAGYKAESASAETANAESAGNKTLIQRINTQTLITTRNMEQMVEDRAPNARVTSLANGLIKRYEVWLKETPDPPAKPTYDQVVSYVAQGEKVPFIFQLVTGSPQKNYDVKEKAEHRFLLERLANRNKYEIVNTYGQRFKLNGNSNPDIASIFSDQFDELIVGARDMIQVAGSGDPTA